MDLREIELELSARCFSVCQRGRLPPWLRWEGWEWCRICGGSGRSATKLEEGLYPLVPCTKPAPYLTYER